MSTVLITGVTGFLGSQLAADLARRGFTVIGSTSGEAGLRVPTPGAERKMVLRLGRPFDPALIQGVNTLIHCAWDLRRGTIVQNVEGTRQLVEAAERAGVAHQVFVSTYSAHPAAVTEYGRGKLAAEQCVLERGHAVLRLGLVIGPGGIFRRLSDMLARHRVVPLVGGRRSKAPVIALSDLLHAVGVIVEQRLTGVFNLFNPGLVTLEALALEILAESRSRAMLVPVPSSLVLAPLWLLEKVGVSLPINLDNVRGLRANLKAQDRSDLPAFVPRPLALAEMVRAARLATLQADEKAARPAS
jgi:nucleoside-diphosphate-sugar epimerase